MCMTICLPVCVCTTCVPDIPGGQKRVSQLPGTRVRDGCQSTDVVLETEPGFCA